MLIRSLLTQSLIAALLMTIGYYIWYVHINYRFEEISPNKVYKSALIPPSKIGDFLKKNKIKTVVNLLDPRTQDELNPATQSEIDIEENAIAEYNLINNESVKHINIPSKQVPSEDKIEQFLELLDDPNSYPVLIHCYHGTGRAELYSAIYRLEYENWTNQDAREKTRLILSALGYKSSFAIGQKKGDFLNNYITRKNKSNKESETNISSNESLTTTVGIH
ncbi:MAG: dual specificity protein phosphatase family protein [Colwellia sp.]